MANGSNPPRERAPRRSSPVRSGAVGYVLRLPQRGADQAVQGNRDTAGEVDTELAPAPDSVDIVNLAKEQVAVLAFETTYGLMPPLILECVVAQYVLSDQEPTAGPWTFWVGRDVPWHSVRPTIWQNLARAPAWSEVAERIVQAVGDRLLVMHDREQYDVLRAHLPDWEPRGLLVTRGLARQVWPDMASYDLQTGRTAGLEVRSVALLLRELMHDAALRPEARRGMPPMT
jgi:hypothetical protein